MRERFAQRTAESIGDRLAHAPQRVPLIPEDGGKPVPPDVTARNAETLRAILAGRPDPATRAKGEDFETVWRTTDAVVERFYAQWPELRWFDLLAGADDRLRKPADDAAAAFTLATAPDVPAIVATCRVGEPWVMHSPDDFERACAAIEGVIHCDLQICGPR